MATQQQQQVKEHAKRPSATKSGPGRAIRALGMPEASEDFVKVCRALHHVVGERGYENADEMLQSLDIALAVAYVVGAAARMGER